GAFDGQVAGHCVVVRASGFDARALEGDRRVLVDLQEVRAAQIAVTLLVVGLDARGLDVNRHRGGCRVVWIDLTAGRDFAEVTADGHHPEVLDREFDLKMVGIDLPGHIAPQRLLSERQVSCSLASKGCRSQPRAAPYAD